MTKLKHTSHSEEAQEHREDNVACSIEAQTAKKPFDVWFWAAFAASGVSMLFHGTGKREDGHSVGQWVAPLLLFSVYNKLVKTAGLIAHLNSVPSKPITLRA